MANPIRCFYLNSTRTRLKWVAHSQAIIRAYDDIGFNKHHFCIPPFSSELTFVLEGEYQISMGPYQQQTILRPGHGCLLLQGTPHTSPTTPGTKVLIIDLKQPFFPDIGLIPFSTQAISPMLEKLLQKVWESPETELPPAFIFHLDAFIGQLSDGNMLPFEHIHNSKRLIGIKQYLDLHYQEPLRISDVAQRFSCDRFYLVRSFKQNFGISPSAYIQNLREDHFLWSMLLSPNSNNLMDRALEAGFSDYANFYRKIQTQYGASPSQLVA